MSESHSISKIAIFIGLAFVLIAAFNPSAGAAWTNFQSSIQGFPTFNNPFSTQIIGSHLTPAGGFCYANDGAVCNGFTTPTPNGCTFANGHLCLINPEKGDSAYITLVGDDGANNDNFNVDMSTDTFPDYSIQSVELNVWCRSPNTTATPFKLKAANVGVPITLSGTCAVGSTYTRLTTIFDHQIVSSPFGVATRFGVSRDGAQPGAIARFTGVQLIVYFTPEQVTCGGNVFENAGCQIANFGRIIYKGIIFFVNAVIFIGQVLIYLINIIIQFFSLTTYFFNISGMPPILQGILTVLFIGVLLFIILAILGKVRGTGNTG